MDGVETPDRDEQSGRAADQTEDRAFDQNQPHQPPAARAHRGAHRQLFAARERARQLQVGDIRAGDEQNAADGGEEEMKILPIIAHAGVEQGARSDPATGIGARIFSRQFMRDVVEIGARLLQGHAWFEAAQSGKARMVVALQDIFLGAQVA